MKKKITSINFADFLKGNNDEKKTSSDKDQSPFKLTRKYVLALLGLGVCWMIASSLFTNSANNTNSMLSPISTETSGSPKTEEPSVPASGSGGKSLNIIQGYEKDYEKQLTDILNDMVGVSNVTVEVNVDGSEKNIYQTNRTNRSQQTEETDKQGGKRNIDDNSVEEQVVIINDGEKEVPVIVQTQKPAIRGVLVIAKGANKIEVKQLIREAVTRLLDVPSHRVSVLPKK
ncbi:stage III sporulation protein AG [Bacillus sp. EAC]|uniref:stage III sporulation protein AG n=1 Tax=Bacillus sp. EAC TaxID=1978338 RepID=UPI000B4493BD|nr:stage III sporulation protein AG [Bacillus sp. EAC]